MAVQSERDRLSAVLRAGRGVITADRAMSALGIERRAASKVLARWQDQGWIVRARRGLYLPVPLTSERGDQVVEDPWELAPQLFSPGYVGGLSAAHYWDLTEQIFRSLFVFTGRPVRHVKATVLGVPFVLHHLAENKIFGTASVWRGQTKVQVSDLDRTIVDMLDDPANGGGIRHVQDCLRAYFSETNAQPSKLVEYAERLGNGAIFKRLGFLAERSGGPESLIEQCRERLTEGVVKLDPSIPSPRLYRRWRLWLPQRWFSGKARDD